MQGDGARSRGLLALVAGPLILVAVVAGLAAWASGAFRDELDEQGYGVAVEVLDGFRIPPGYRLVSEHPDHGAAVRVYEVEGAFELPSPPAGFAELSAEGRQGAEAGWIGDAGQGLGCVVWLRRFGRATQGGSLRATLKASCAFAAEAGDPDAPSGAAA